MYLIAVSGSPESMLLLEKYKKKPIVAAHINYHRRKDSEIDESIVRAFCDAHKIPCEVLDIDILPDENFELWARATRYSFFKKIYKKYKCTKLIIPHLKDQFVEMALGQQQTGEVPRYYGLPFTEEFEEMNIERPFVDRYFAEEVLDIVNRKQIRYAVDYNNKKVPFNLDLKTVREKQDLFRWFVMSNKILKKKFKRVDYAYMKWEGTQWDCKLLKAFKFDKEEIVKEFLAHNAKGVMLTPKAFKEVFKFVMDGKDKQEFKLDSRHRLIKNNDKLSVIEK